jgi:hypothetical protein
VLAQNISKTFLPNLKQALFWGYQALDKAKRGIKFCSKAR